MIDVHTDNNSNAVYISRVTNDGNYRSAAIVIMAEELSTLIDELQFAQQKLLIHAKGETNLQRNATAVSEP